MERNNNERGCQGKERRQERRTLRDVGVEGEIMIV
jgi:hypothetical protein